MTEEKCYALYFENQDLTNSPKASITCLNKFKPEDDPSSSKQKICFVPEKGRGLQSSSMGRQPCILTGSFLSPVKWWIVTLRPSFELAESDWEISGMMGNIGQGSYMASIIKILFKNLHRHFSYSHHHKI